MTLVLSTTSKNYSETQISPFHYRCKWNSPIENWRNFKYISVQFSLSSSFIPNNALAVNIFSNLIEANIFNPDGQLFSINLQSQSAYVNKRFEVNKLNTNKFYLENIIFDFKFLAKTSSGLQGLDYNLFIVLE